MIKIEHLSYRYKGTQRYILQDVNLLVKERERVVIKGSSGSGKSTLLKLLAGFISPTEGEIVFDGKTVSKETKVVVAPHQRDVAMVFQDLALWPHMSIEENIEFGLKINGVCKKERREKVDAFLSLVGLEGYNKKKPQELSGGEQQRVALARALIVSPKILLMDEPLSSLDEELNRHLREEIVTLQKKFGFILIYVTHNNEEAEAIGERIVLMKDGSII